MPYESPHIVSDQTSLVRMPAWVTSRAGESAQNVAFLSGATFAFLDMILQQKDKCVPKALLANTLALQASVATSRLEGRLASEQDIRDAFYLTPAGDALGPDGDMLAFWRSVVHRPLRGRDWSGRIVEQAVEKLDQDVAHRIAKVVEDAGQIGPLAAACGAIKAVIQSNDRAERLACFLSDTVLAKSFGWDHPLPLTALHLKKAMLRDLRDGKTGSDIAVQDVITKGAQTAYRVALSLTRRADVLKTVAPKLRTRGSADAVALFLREDAVAPSSMLAPHIQGTNIPMTGRAARRLCDRLVELGAIKELTGRSTFRLFGIAP
ncbi:DUF1403 family protein [Nitratireductor sp. XY-223]|uniref:DUF1403 family protein n=1 Tax=Nitratireductor sp. XY-223 TaxID=2561926 RepID=UPI0010A9BAE6|nr:DUF1403 family protein [Nitratireductor sp. XY-223]